MILDEYDEAIYRESFIMAQSVHDFLQRQSTQKMIDLGLLDEDVVQRLVETNDRMWMIRTQRVAEARRGK